MTKLKLGPTEATSADGMSDPNGLSAEELAARAERLCKQAIDRGVNPEWAKEAAKTYVIAYRSVHRGIHH